METAPTQTCHQARTGAAPDIQTNEGPPWSAALAFATSALGRRTARDGRVNWELQRRTDGGRIRVELAGSPRFCASILDRSRPVVEMLRLIDVSEPTGVAELREALLDLLGEADVTDSAA